MGLLLLCIPLFFWQLDGYSLFNVTEARQAEVARQMWVRHDWVTPMYNGKLYFDKPVLLHWLIALGFPIFGINEWAVRIPSALSATALVLTTWFFVNHFTNPRIALLAATMLAVNPFTFALGRTGQHDMLLTFFMTTALYCWYFAYSTGKAWGYLSCFGLLALAVLAKGPIALVLCSLTIGVFLIGVGQWKNQLADLPWGWGALIFGGITLPWYALVIQANGWQFVNLFFLHNNVSRFLSVNQNQAGPEYYYLFWLLVGFFPWIMLLPGAFIHTANLRWLQLRYWQQQSPAQQLGLFMTLWLFTVVAFMSFSATKLPWYIYPGLPPLAYLCAQAWNQPLVTAKRSLKLSLGAICIVDLLIAGGLMLAPRLIANESAQQIIQRTGILDLWIILCLIAAIGTGFSLVCTQVLWSWLVGVVTFAVFALSSISLMPAIDSQVGGGRLLPIAQALQQETCETCSTNFPAALGVIWPSLNFYSGLSRIERFEKPCQAQEQLKKPQRLLLVTTDADLQRVNLDLGDYQPSYTSDPFKLFIIPPNSNLVLEACQFPKFQS
jgi:4-amino-4-deoxy-L-arabinose transferase-like glycosyltransferase